MKSRMDALTSSRLAQLRVRCGIHEAQIIDFYTCAQFSDFVVNRYGSPITFRVHDCGMITER